MDVCPGQDLNSDRETFYPSEADGQNVLDDLIPPNLTEPDVELFMNLTH